MKKIISELHVGISHHTEGDTTIYRREGLEDNVNEALQEIVRCIGEAKDLNAEYQKAKTEADKQRKLDYRFGICTFYRNGNCDRGDDCQFKHINSRRDDQSSRGREWYRHRDRSDSSSHRSRSMRGRD
jgi:hypothetical protein